MEKRKKRNLIIWIITGCVALAILLTVCFKFVYTDQNIGNFRVRMYINKCYILGTTEQGNKQRYLVIPKEIKGRKVACLGLPNRIPGVITGARIKSDVIEKVYFEDITYGLVSTFSGCSNIDKILFIEDWGTSYNTNCNYYFTPEVYRSKDSPNNTQNFPANVLYRHNYDGAENDGYYWIDDYDYGSKIEFIPPEPKRKGYTFGGWYKEPECINKWDFETDVLPEERTETNEEGEEEIVYQETKLYAKWSR